MTFTEICIQDGKVTKAGELAERMLFKRATGKCVHELIDISKSGDGMNLYCSCGSRFYTNFGAKEIEGINILEIDTLDYFEYHMFAWLHGDYDDPPLATSLDAHAKHIWPVMDELTALKYIEELGVIASSYWSDCPNGMKCNWVDWNQQTAKPIHHLEAELRAYNLYDEWEATVNGNNN